MKTGVFTISLDFEIHWGVSDHRTVESYRENLSNVPKVVKDLLQLFTEKNIHCTWATVGMLFCHTKKELFQYVDEANRPGYNNPKLSNFIVAETAGENEATDPFHYANSLVKQIIATPNQEMSTHTYSHYYCLEPGQKPEQFYHDLQAVRATMRKEGAEALSIVFPRNQYSEEYLEQCRKTGIRSYRGNFPSRLYRAEAKSSESRMKRLGRLIDTYLPLTGSRIVQPEMNNGLLNIPGSCFLRPFNKKLSFLEGLRLRRIKKEMTKAARQKALYHLWWHPHNFGKNLEANFSILKQVIAHYEQLNKEFGMRSLTMDEIYQEHTH